MNILVVPTIREDCIKKFLQAWENELFDEVIIIEDNPDKTFNIGLKHHYSWKEIHDEWGSNSWVISRRDSAIRCWGHWKAWQLGADITFCLDDDCIPNEPFISGHLNNLNNTSKWTYTTDLRTRGLPYLNFGNLPVVANMGLWTNIPDLDAINQLTNPVTNYIPKAENRVMPHGQYFSLCGMNFCFKREIAVLTYFPLMGLDQPYKRFDDIWFGIIFKKICDHLGYHITVGHPFIEHQKASNPFENLIKEAPGIKLNETFWETINNITSNQYTFIMYGRNRC